MRDLAPGHYDNDGSVLELFDVSLDELKALVSNYGHCELLFRVSRSVGGWYVVKVLWLDQNLATVVLTAMIYYCRPLELKQIHRTQYLNLP